MVPYEIGIAKAKGLMIVPLLQHPALELPAYIANLKYCKNLDEFKMYIAMTYEGDLPVSVDISAAEAIMLDENHVVFAIHDLDKDHDAADPKAIPALIITVENKTGTEIELAQPFITFKKPQEALIPGKKLMELACLFHFKNSKSFRPMQKGLSTYITRETQILN